MERVLLTRYPRTQGPSTDSVTLLQVLRVGGRDYADSLHNGLKALDKRLVVTIDNQTNIVRVDVDAHSPTLAAAVAGRFVDYLNDFNTKTRQSQARERRKFIEGRLVDGGRDLQGAEQDLRTFYERNRSWQQAPQLVFEEGRLRRQVEIRQEVYLTLRREYETARIEEVNDTPVITVIDAAVPPERKSKPKRVLFALVAFMLGGIAAVSWAFSAEYLDRMRREGASEYHEFRSLLQRLRERMGALVRPMGQRRT